MFLHAYVQFDGLCFTFWFSICQSAMLHGSLAFSPLPFAFVGLLHAISCIRPTGFSEARTHVKSWCGFISPCVRTRLAFVLGTRAFTGWGCWFAVAHFYFVTLFNWGSERSVMRSPLFMLCDSDRHGTAMQLCAVTGGS